MFQFYAKIKNNNFASRFISFDVFLLQTIVKLRIFHNFSSIKLCLERSSLSFVFENAIFLKNSSRKIKIPFLTFFSVNSTIEIVEDGHLSLIKKREITLEKQTTGKK